MGKVEAAARRRRELLKAREVMRKMRFAPIVWNRGDVSVEETFQRAPIFAVTRGDTLQSIRTDADGIGPAIAKLRRQVAIDRVKS